MTSSLRVAALSTLFLVACTTNVVRQVGSDDPAAPVAPVEQTPATPVEEEQPQEEPFELFGEALDTTIKSASFDEIVTAPDSFNRQQVITSGTVRAVCQKRGCWMEVRPDELREGSSATVRFLDYGFFMPLDSRGARVKLQGTVQVSMLSKAQVDEFEAEGGTVVDKQPDGSAKALLIIASGVEMRGRKTAE